MGRRHFKPEQIIHMLREAEIKLAVGKTTGEVCRELGISFIAMLESMGSKEILTGLRVTLLSSGSTPIETFAISGTLIV